jgi:hypothetical protein
MKKFLIAVAIAASFLTLGGNARAEGLFSFIKPKGVPDTPPHHLAPPFNCVDCEKEKVEKVVKTHTVELRRIGFTKWEEHCCGIKMKGNYMKVTYETFYSDGSSTVWEKEYRS